MGRFGRKLTAYTMSALMLFSGMGFSNGIKNVKAADNTGETSQQIEVRECENTKAGSGNVIVELEGMDYTSAQQEMLNRINQVREEACNEGNVPDPRDTDPSDGISFLTPEDYVPLKIGVNSTKVAQIRAAEGSVKFSHTRPKGGYAYTMLLDREAEHAGENLAWKSFNQEEIENNRSELDGWINEKKDWIEQIENDPDRPTGHYASIVNPDYEYIGISTFNPNNDLFIDDMTCTAGAFARVDSVVSEYETDKCENVIQKIEIPVVDVLKIDIVGDSILKPGDEDIFTSYVSAKFTSDELGRSNTVFDMKICDGVTWSTSDSSIISVDSIGKISAKNYGKATITATIGSGDNVKSVSREIIVVNDGVTVINVKNPNIVYTESCVTPIINRIAEATLSDGSVIDVDVEWNMPSDSEMSDYLETYLTSREFTIKGKAFGNDVTQTVHVNAAEVLDVYPDTDKEVVYAYSGVEPTYPMKAEIVFSNRWIRGGYDIVWEKESLQYYKIKEGGTFTLKGSVSVSTDDGNKKFPVEQKIVVFGDTVTDVEIDESSIDTVKNTEPILPKAKVKWSSGDETDEEITWEETDDFLSGYKNEPGTSYKIKGSYIDLKGVVQKTVEITVNVKAPVVVERIDFDNSEIITENGSYPELPTEATVYWSNSLIEKKTISWKTITKENYQNINGGRFEAKGLVAGKEISVFYTVPAANIVSIQKLKIIETVEGVCPEFPKTVQVIWDNGMETSEKITWDDISEDDYNIPGVQKTVDGKLKVRDIDLSITYNVNAKALISLSWKMPEEGSGGNPSGMDSYGKYDISKLTGTLVAKYNNGTSEDLDIRNEKILWAGYNDKSMEPTQEITFAYKYGADIETESVKLHLYPKKINSIKVSELLPQKLGSEELNLTGATVEATYNSGERVEYPLDYLVGMNKAEIRGYDLSKKGQQSIEIIFDASYYALNDSENKVSNDISINTYITVNERLITKFELASWPDTISYIIGQTVDLSKFSVRVTYEDNKTETIKYDDFESNGIKISDYDPTLLKDQYIIISKQDKYARFLINIRDKDVLETSYFTKPDVTNYFKGQMLNMSGSKLYVDYDFGPSEEIDIDEELNKENSRIKLVMTFGSEGEQKTGGYNDIGKLSVGTFGISVIFKDEPIKLENSHENETYFNISVWDSDKMPSFSSVSDDVANDIENEISSNSTLDDIKNVLDGVIIKMAFSNGDATFVVSPNMVEMVEELSVETATSQEKKLFNDINDDQVIKRIKIALVENDIGEKIYTSIYLAVQKDNSSGENGSESGGNGSGGSGSDESGTGESDTGGNGTGGNGSGGNASSDGKESGDGGSGKESGKPGDGSGTGKSGNESGTDGKYNQTTTESAGSKADKDSTNPDVAAAKVGSVVSAGGANYKVTSSDSVSYKAPTQKSATGITIPATVKIGGKTYKVSTIEANAFKGNAKLKKVVIGKNVQTVGKNAFAGCTNLTTVSLGSNVTTIGDGAFSGCKKLTKIVIPAKVKKIGKKAFYKCSNLKRVIIKTKKLGKKNIGAAAFKGINKKAVVTVPKAKKKVYTKYINKAGLPKSAKVK